MKECDNQNHFYCCPLIILKCSVRRVGLSRKLLFTYNIPFSHIGKRENHSSSYFAILVPYVVCLVFSEDNAILQIAVDKLRYSLYEKLQNIQICTLGSDEKHVSKVSESHPVLKFKRACYIVKTIEDKHVYLFVYSSALEINELKCAYVIATTESSVKLHLIICRYFTNSSPYTLSLPRVKLSPGFAVNTVVATFYVVHMVCSK